MISEHNSRTPELALRSYSPENHPVRKPHQITDSCRTISPRTEELRFGNHHFPFSCRSILGRSPTAISAGTFHNPPHSRSSLRGGRHGAVHAGRKSGQVAPGAHNLVFRNLHPHRRNCRISHLQSRISSAIQLLLQNPRQPSRASAARNIFAPAWDKFCDIALTWTRRCIAYSPLAIARNTGPRRTRYSSRTAAQELILTDILHAFWTQPLRPAYAPRPTHLQTTHLQFHGLAPLRWIAHPGGTVEIGAPDRASPLTTSVPVIAELLLPYSLGIPLGHQRRVLSTSSMTRVISAPSCGSPTDGTPSAVRLGKRRSTGRNAMTDGVEFSLQGMNPLDPAAPVSHVSYYEADAFARWSGARLPWKANGSRRPGIAPSPAICLSAGPWSPAHPQCHPRRRGSTVR